MLPLEPSDPALVIPRGALQVSLRDMTEQSTIADIDSEPLPPPSEPLGGAFARSTKSAQKWPIAVVASCILHAAVAMVLLAAPQGWHSPDDPTQIEGADQAGMMLVGNANDDQAMAGDATNVTLVPIVDAKPVETIEAQPVTVDEAVQPVEQAAVQAPAVETLEPVTDPAPPPETAERVQPEKPEPTAAPEPAPEILAVTPQQPDDSDNVVQTTTTAALVEPLKEVEPVKETETVTTEDIPTPKFVEVVPEARPVEQKAPTAKEKPVKQAKSEPKEAPAKPVRKKTNAGSGGANQADAKRGVANGQTEGETAIASKGGAKSSVGNAAVSNYPGKVAAKLRRVARSLSRSAQASARNNAQVSFVVNTGGDVGTLRLVKSSGSPGLDEAALAIIRRAAPFPPIPPQAGRSTWAFTLPIGPF